MRRYAYPRQDTTTNPTNIAILQNRELRRYNLLGRRDSVHVLEVPRRHEEFETAMLVSRIGTRRREERLVYADDYGLIKKRKK
jgi:hypothetical protein